MSKRLTSSLIPPIYIRRLCELLTTRGIDAAAVLAKAGIGLDALEAQGSQPSIASIDRFITLALKLTDCPWLGFELGNRLHAMSHGTLGFASVASGSVGCALKTIARFTTVRTPALVTSVASRSDALEFNVSLSVDLGASEPFVLAAFLVSVERLLKELSGANFASARYRLPGRAPSWAARTGDYLDGELKFSGTGLSMCIPNALLEVRSLTSDAAAYQAAERELERTLEANSASIVASVRVWLKRSDLRETSAAQVAAGLGVAPRTLFRRLHSEGSSLQKLIDEVRFAEAAWRLEHTDEAVERIAERVGFQDTSNFSRTFKRMTSLTPRAYRLASKRLA